MSEDWPAWATEEVAVVEWDPSWLPLAEKLGRDVEQRLGEVLCGAVEHVGSTAVPGLAAKPVVDLMAPVDSQAVARSADEALAAGGWWLVPPEFDGRPWRRFFVLAEGFASSRSSAPGRARPSALARRADVSRCAARPAGDCGRLCGTRAGAGQPLPRRPRGLQRR